MSRHTGLIIGRIIFLPDVEGQGLFLTGLQFPCFSKSHQYAAWFAKQSLRSLCKYKHDLLSRMIAGVGNHCGHFLLRHHLRIDGKACIAQSISKRIHHFFWRKGRKIAVPHINIFGVEILIRISVIGGRRIICNVIRDCISQPSTRRHGTVQQIEHTVAAFLSALPDIHDSVWVVGLYPFHVDNISDI